MLALAAPPLVGSAQAPVEGPVAITVDARQIASFELRDPSRREFGQLLFRGGLVLSSPFKEFGGISALRLRPDGERFIAVADKGWWLRGRITYDGIHPAGVTEAEMAPILGADGKPLAARGWFDTEAIAEDGGTLYVGIERVNQIVRFNYGRDGLLARGTPIPLPAGIKALPFNRGIEALVFVPKGLPLAGTLIAFSERALDKAGNILAFLIGGPSPGTFTLKRSAEFDISDAAQLPGGDILLLERKFAWNSGLFVRIRRIALGGIRPGAVADGAILMEADLGYELDNMEGLSVHRAGSGELVLTLISDNNFSMLQRTLLLQFTLGEP
jgi:hypothetical protein